MNDINVYGSGVDGSRLFLCVYYSMMIILVCLVAGNRNC